SQIFSIKSEKTPSALRKEDEKKQENGDFIDYISFNPVLIKLIDIEKWKKDVTPKYLAIINMLREGPKTIKEIHQNHSKFEEIADRMFNEKAHLVQEKNRQTITTKKENTIYRYVKDLIKAGFVIEAGRRMVKNQTSTQILYSRTAKVFYTLGIEKDYWISEKGKNIIYALGMTLRHHFEKLNFKKEEFFQLISKYSELKTQYLEQALISVSDEWIIDPLFRFEKYEQETMKTTTSFMDWLITTNNKEEFCDQITDSF
ncbi:MAG: hypothetical protein ACXAC7_20325, partial [Candidatus Hodarchaeales archaeon]